MPNRLGEIALGWSPRALARRINQVLGVGSVASTSPYHWRDSGCVPRPPLPELTAWVLSRELGRPVTVAELWQGRTSGSPLVLPADIEMDGPWSRASALRLISDWVVAGLLDRRHFLSISGAAILAIASSYQHAESGMLVAALERGSVDNPLLDQIEQSIPLVWNNDCSPSIRRAGATRRMDGAGLRPASTTSSGYDQPARTFGSTSTITPAEPRSPTTTAMTEPVSASPGDAPERSPTCSTESNLMTPAQIVSELVTMAREVSADAGHNAQFTPPMISTSCWPLPIQARWRT